MMVLIISTEVDHSTNNVIKYLVTQNVSVIRLGEQQLISGICIKTSNKGIYIDIKVGGKYILLDRITTFWSRKDDIRLFENLQIQFSRDESNIESLYLEKYLIEEETNSIKELLHHELEKKNHLGNVKIGEGNKLISFSIAHRIGLKIPYTFVSSNTSELLKENINKHLIAKPIEDAYKSILNGIEVTTFYDSISNEKIKNKQDEIFPSCLQEYIDKKIELRIFYLKEKCYSMAIFSQNDEQTKIDFRNYNDKKPNRMVPYNLPIEVEKKIILFMKEMKLKTGSLDLILTPYNEYVFLEVNPVGQYGMVANPCNYPLDKLIAQELISK